MLSDQFRENLIQSFRNFKERFIGDIGTGTVAQLVTSLRTDVNNLLDNKANKSTINEYGSTPSNLAQFVQGTATGNLMMNFKFRDSKYVLGLGATWVKGYIQYQNPYGTQYSVNGMGIASADGGNPIFIKITGTGASFTVTRRDLTQDTTTGTTYNAGSCPDNTTFATNGSIKRAYDSAITTAKSRKCEYAQITLNFSDGSADFQFPGDVAVMSATFIAGDGPKGLINFFRTSGRNVWRFENQYAGSNSYPVDVTYFGY